MTDYQLDFDRGYLPESIMSLQMSYERTVHPYMFKGIHSSYICICICVCMYTWSERQKTRDGIRGAQGRREAREGNRARQTVISGGKHDA